jgi:hypothetical protein
VRGAARSGARLTRLIGNASFNNSLRGGPFFSARCSRPLVFGRAAPYNVHTFRSPFFENSNPSLHRSACPLAAPALVLRIAPRERVSPSAFRAPAALPSAQDHSAQHELPLSLTKTTARRISLLHLTSAKILVAGPHAKLNRDPDLPPCSATQVQDQGIMSPLRVLGFRDKTHPGGTPSPLRGPPASSAIVS